MSGIINDNIYYNESIDIHPHSSLLTGNGIYYNNIISIYIIIKHCNNYNYSEKMELNQDQKQALISMLEWELNDKPAFTLVGYAGTGKTTIINEYLKVSNLRFRAAVTAPTHKAREVANAMVKNIECTTIHKLCGLKLNLDLADFRLDKLQFMLFGVEEIDNYKLVIIDECSMINKDLYELLIDKAVNKKVKLIFIGDPLQLPPIEAKGSKDKVKTSLSMTFTVNEGIMLKQIMRTDEDNPITKIINATKKMVVATSRDKLILEYQDAVKDYTRIETLLQGGNDYNEMDKIGYTITSSSQEFVDRYLELNRFSSNDVDSLNFIKYGAWTNKSINSFNYYIHNKLFGESLIYVGERLIGNKTCATPDGDALFYNSKEYIVTEVFKCEIRNMNIMRLKMQYLGDMNVVRSTYVNIVHPTSYNVYRELFNHLFEQALKLRGKYWKTFFNFVDEFHLLEDIDNNTGADYVGKPKSLFKNLSYAYGVTIHKLQGSSINHMFVNYKDISYNRDVNEVAKLLYVACSRAKQSLHILI